MSKELIGGPIYTKAEREKFIYLKKRNSFRPFIFETLNKIYQSKVDYLKHPLDMDDVPSKRIKLYPVDEGYYKFGRYVYEVADEKTFKLTTCIQHITKEQYLDMDGKLINSHRKSPFSFSHFDPTLDLYLDNMMTFYSMLGNECYLLVDTQVEFNKKLGKSFFNKLFKPKVKELSIIISFSCDNMYVTPNSDNCERIHFEANKHLEISQRISSPLEQLNLKINNCKEAGVIPDDLLIDLTLDREQFKESVSILEIINF